MMDNTEADNFRRIQLMSGLERAREVVAQYRHGIDYYRGQIEDYFECLGRIRERLGEPEKGEHDDN